MDVKLLNKENILVNKASPVTLFSPCDKVFKSPRHNPT